MRSERDEIIESIRQRLRCHREHLLRRLGGEWPEESELQRAVEESTFADPTLWELQRTENALDAIRDGTYGTCSRCGGMIAGERLEAIVFAHSCIPCQMKAARHYTN